MTEPQLWLDLTQPAHHTDLEQQAEAVPAVCGRHAGVVLVPVPRLLVLERHDRVAAEFTGLAMPGHEPIQPPAAGD